MTGFVMIVSDENDARYHQIAFRAAIASPLDTETTIYKALLSGMNVIIPMSLEIEFQLPENIPILYSHEFLVAATGSEEDEQYPQYLH